MMQQVIDKGDAAAHKLELRACGSIEITPRMFQPKL
jgi:hypothetical protein